MPPQADGGVGRPAPNTGRGLGVRGAAQSPASPGGSGRMDEPLSRKGRGLMIRRPFVALRLEPGPGHRTETNKHPMEDYHDGRGARSARFNDHSLLQPT